MHNKKNCLNLKRSVLRWEKTGELSGRTCVRLAHSISKSHVGVPPIIFALYLMPVIGLERDRVIPKSVTELENVLGSNKIGLVGTNL